MKNIKQSTLRILAITLFFVAGISFVDVASAAAPITSTGIIYVARDGSGDYNADGVNDHVQINQALSFIAGSATHNTVYLKTGTYIIDDTLIIGSDTILTGDSNAVIKLVNHADWPSGKDLIGNANRYNPSVGDRNIVITGFEIDGNDVNNYDYDSATGKDRAKGYGYYNLIELRYADNVHVYNMYMHDSMGDGLKVMFCDGVNFHDNVIYKHGHDGLYSYSSSNVEAYNNNITVRTNSGLRVDHGRHIKFYSNTITGITGGAGISIYKTGLAIMDDIEIFDNLIYSTLGPGIMVEGYYDNYPADAATGVHIYHNRIYDAGKGWEYGAGITLNGFYGTLIENNVIDGSYGVGIVHRDVNGNIPVGSGYNTIIKNNIISNTRPYWGHHYGIWNDLSSTHSFTVRNNCLYQNGTNYLGSNINQSGDIYSDPLYANRAAHDFHLKSKFGRWSGTAWVIDSVQSPAIDAGDSSDYSKEQEDNGNRINMGAYGGTDAASLSSSTDLGNLDDPTIPAPTSTPTPTTDETDPTVGITCPREGDTYSNPTASVSGFASDNVAVSSVEVRVNSGAWQVATGTTSWVISGLALVLGSNTISARATDSSGNVFTVAITVTHDPTSTSSPLTGEKVILYDTKVSETDRKYGPTNFALTNAYANRANWKQVPYGITTWSFTGTAVLINGDIMVHMHDMCGSYGCESPFMYGVFDDGGMSGSGYSQAGEMYGVYGGMWDTHLLSTTIIKNTENEITVRHSANKPSLGAGVVTTDFTMKSNSSWFERKGVDSGDYYNSLHARAGDGFIIAPPDFGTIGNDIIYDAAYINGADYITYDLPGTHDEILMQSLGSWDHNQLYMAMRKNFSKGVMRGKINTKSLYGYLGFVESIAVPESDSSNPMFYGQTNYQDTIDSQRPNVPIIAGQVYNTGKTVSVAGRWRLSARINGSYYTFNITDGNLSFTSPAAGTLEAVVWYLYDRTASTPSYVHTPMDMYRAVSGITSSASDPVCTAPVPANCGDGIPDPLTESCVTCPEDYGACPPTDICAGVVCATPNTCQINPGVCQNLKGVATCTYPNDYAICDDNDGDPCTMGKCTSFNWGTTSSCITDPNRDIQCKTPGFCQVGGGKCVPTGLTTYNCTYSINSDPCDLDNNQCTLDVCKSSDEGVTGNCIATNLDICKGLVPCGRLVDNPTTGWDESSPCEFCHGVLLLNQGTNFLIKLAGIITVLALIVTGLLFIISAGNPEKKNLAKTSFKWIIFGFIIIFIAWLLIDFLLSAWGFLDPLGGQWNVIC